MNKLTGKIAVITGGGSGVGKAVANIFGTRSPEKETAKLIPQRTRFLESSTLDEKLFRSTSTHSQPKWRNPLCNAAAAINSMVVPIALGSNDVHSAARAA